MDDFDVFISQNAQTYRYLINNRNFESFVNVIKVDAESGKSIPYAGAGFKIYDPQGNQVKMTFTYPTPTTIDAVSYTHLLRNKIFSYYNSMVQSVQIKERKKQYEIRIQKRRRGKGSLT